MSAIAPTLQGFFTERLVKQPRLSPRTIASYRDSLKLLFVFVQQRTGKPPTTLDWADLDVEVIGAFLDISKPTGTTGACLRRSWKHGSTGRTPSTRRRRTCCIATSPPPPRTRSGSRSSRYRPVLDWRFSALQS